MSDKLRRACSLTAAVVGAQALAFTALAQQPPTDTTRDTTSQSSSATSTATGTGTPANERGSAASRPGTGANNTTTDRTSSRSRAASDTMKSVTPQSFAAQAAVIDKAEIELAQLALDKSKNEEIRKYAERMVKDHSATSAKLKKIASQENISLPQSLDAEHQATKQKLSSLQGEAFDKAYRQQMAKGHDKAVALFQSASQTQQMPEELREFAASTLSTLKDHREDAHDMHEDAQKEGA